MVSFEQNLESTIGTVINTTLRGFYVMLTYVLGVYHVLLRLKCSCSLVDRFILKIIQSSFWIQLDNNDCARHGDARLGRNRYLGREPCGHASGVEGLE
jgi:hypothetical protein